MNEENMRIVRGALKKFLKSSSSEINKFALFISDLDEYVAQIENASRLHLVKSWEDLIQFINFLKNENQWLSIALLLKFIKEYRLGEFHVIISLSAMNRWNEISILSDLINKQEWSEVSKIKQLAVQGEWDKITENLSHLANPKQPSNVFEVDVTLSEDLRTMLDNIAKAGLTKKQAQEINQKLVVMRIEEHSQKIRELNSAKVKVLASEINHEQVSTSQDVLEKNLKEVYPVLRELFLKENYIIRSSDIDTDGKYSTYIWDKNLCRYRIVTKLVELNSRFEELAYRELVKRGYADSTSLSKADVKSAIYRLKYVYAPTMEECGVAMPDECQVFFRNGYYDLRNGKFYAGDTKNFFHFFCLPYDYDDEGSEPILFEKMLFEIFDGDLLKIRMSYQIIGAIISDVTTLKTLYVFKGVPNGGKSTLSNFISSLLDKNTVELLPNIDNIKPNQVGSYEKNRKLLYVDDASNKIWSPETISYLKSRSRGIGGTNAVTFKILINTNHMILCSTPEDKESLKTRLVILPFQKDMRAWRQNFGDENVKLRIKNDFQDERRAIVKKALYEFKKVLDNDGEFVKLSEDLSDVVKVVLRKTPNGSTIESKFFQDVALEESEVVTIEMPVYQKISIKNQELLHMLRENFEITDDAKKFMTAQKIYEYIKQELPNTNGRVEDIGKVVKEVFGECKIRREQRIFYAITQKSKLEKSLN